MRMLTPAMIRAITGQQTKEVFIVLTTFKHADLPTPLRFSSDPTIRHSLTPLLYKTISRGLTFFYIPMSIQLPTETLDSPASAQLSVSNVGRELINTLRSMDVGTKPATVDMEIVLGSDPDVVGYSIPTLDMVQADWDADAVNLTLTIESLDREPFPSGNFDASGFPGLF